MEQNKQSNNETLKVRPMGHYRLLTQALAVAMTHCWVWREVSKGVPYTLKEIFEFAKKLDAEHPVEGHQFYMVSREGAIGLSPGLEWMTKWMFIPMEPGKERDFLVRKMREELQTERAVQDAVEQAVQRGIAAEKAAKSAPQTPVAPPVAPVPPTTPAATGMDDNDETVVAEAVVVAPQPTPQPTPHPVVVEDDDDDATVVAEVVRSIPTAEAPKTALKFCPFCGAKLIVGSSFCGNCGKSIIIS